MFAINNLCILWKDAIRDYQLYTGNRYFIENNKEEEQPIPGFPYLQNPETVLHPSEHLKREMVLVWEKNAMEQFEYRKQNTGDLYLLF